MPVTALDVHSRSLVLDGRPFGAAGAYEKLAGTLHFAVDPAHPLHGTITDLSLAPRGADGRVAFQSDFYLLRPVDPTRGNRRLLLDVPNRGRKVALGLFNSAVRVPDPAAIEDFGNGFLMRHGWTVAWVGWQHDVPRRDGMMALHIPRVPGVNGLVRCEFQPNTPGDVRPMADRYHIPYAAAELDDPAARMLVREHAGAAPVAIPRSAWRFARREGDRLVPDASHVYLEGGFALGHIYDLVYRSQDPPVVGLALLGVRDTGAFLRWGSAEQGNPCAGALDRSVLFGVSQSGRFLRHMLYLGLDEDEQGRLVFDAVVPHVAGGRRGEFNMRFGQPSVNAQSAAGSLFPFADEAQTDPVTGQRDGLLSRIARRGRWPKIVAINTSAEYWRSDASLIHTDVASGRDVEPPTAVRVYHFAGTQHVISQIMPKGTCAAPANTLVDPRPVMRALILALDRWVKEGAPPPSSVYPRLSDKTLVAADSLRWPRIPGFSTPRGPNPMLQFDYGARFAEGIIDSAPPATLEYRYKVLVPAIDADGNEVAGLRLPEQAVPVATTTGWALRSAEGGAAGELCYLDGSLFAFARTAAERERSGDPRPSLEERYKDKVAFLGKLRAAALELQRKGYLLAEDVDKIVARAEKRAW